MKDRLFEALKRSTADYAEIRVDTEDHTSLAMRKTDIERAVSSSYCGGICRACTKGGWGVVKFDSLDDLAHQVEEACAIAALVGCETTQLAEVTPVVAEHRATLTRDPRGVSLDDKLKLVQAYNEILLSANPAIEITSVSYHDDFRIVHFANTRGSYYRDERPLIGCSLGATPRARDLLQRVFDSVSSPCDYGVVEGLEPRAIKVAARAAALLKAPKVDGGSHDVILDPYLAGIFLHEAFGHLSEADFQYENPKMRELMCLGREIGAKNLNIVDDGTIPGRAGTHPFDDEGTLTQKTHLIRDGMLSGHLHSLETAGKMGAKPTGNARAIGRNHPPIVRMTNTCIENGNLPVADLFAGVDKGIYAVRAFGGQTMLEMFTFSAAYAYRIENGEVGELIRDVVLSGNVFATLKALDGIGNDFILCEGAGGCGKGGQGPLPVSFGSPHVRIRNIVIGGK